MRRWLAFVTLAAVAASATAATTFLEPEAFVAQAFAGEPPEPQTLWLVGALGERASAILGHPPARLRERYWRRGQRTVWILEEIGKERPITVGWIIEGGEIADATVLIYRETRGWEVRFPYFIEQFLGAFLAQDDRLSATIDNVTGATLSVNAMRKMGRLALLLHEHVTAQDQK